MMPLKAFRLLRQLTRVDLVDAVMALTAATAPTADFRQVTPHDTHPIPGGPARSLYVGGDGDVVAVNEAGQEVTFAGVTAGTILPIESKMVKADGTTATNIVAL